MAAEGGREAGSVKDLLYEHPARFEFFQAVRLLAGLDIRGRGIAGDDPDDEAVRFRSHVGFEFPRADITRLLPPGEEGKSAVMTVAFMGMATPGSFGSLPSWYAKEILDQERGGPTGEEPASDALRDFFDLFNHRFISFLWRALEKYSLPVQYERKGRGIYETLLLAVMGLGTGGLAERLDIDVRTLPARGGLLARKPISWSALCGVIGSYFDVEVDIDQFLTGWYDVDREDQSQLGRSAVLLGIDAMAGSSVRLAQYKFAVRLGPLPWQRYQDFFPISDGFHALVELVQLAAGPGLDFEVRLVLPAVEVPPLRLERNPTRACRLGWSTWLNRDQNGDDADDAVLRPGRIGIARDKEVRQ